MDGSGHAVALRLEFESHWGEYEEKLRRYALRILGNEDDAEEVARQAMTDHLESMERRLWNVELVSTEAYLKVIARNLCYALWSRRSRETPLYSSGEEGEKTLKALEEKAMRENDPTSRLNDKIAKGELLNAIPKVVSSKLSDEEKEILYLHFTQQLGAKEIAAVLGKDVDYIRYQLNKLKAKIRYRVKKIK